MVSNSSIVLSLHKIKTTYICSHTQPTPATYQNYTDNHCFRKTLQVHNHLNNESPGAIQCRPTHHYLHIVISTRPDAILQAHKKNSSAFKSMFLPVSISV